MWLIDIIFPNRFSNISSYINKVFKHIIYVPRIHTDNIIMNYLYSIFYLTIFCVDVIDDAISLLYIIFCSIEFMFIIILFWSSNLPGDQILEMRIKICRNFILTECKIMLAFPYLGYYFKGNPGLFKSLCDKCFSIERTAQLECCQQDALGLPWQ